LAEPPPDDRSRAYKYLRRVSGTQPQADNAKAFVEHGARMVEFLECSSALRFSSIPRHDYHATWEGAGFGRSLEPDPFAAGQLLADKAAWFSTNPMRAPLTYSEYREGADPLIAESRRHDDVRTQGAALVAGLGHACLSAGVEVMRGAAVESLSR